MKTPSIQQINNKYYFRYTTEIRFDAMTNKHGLLDEVIHKGYLYTIINRCFTEDPMIVRYSAARNNK